MNNRIKAHVEGHAASMMRNENIQKATLYINRIPCGGKTGCDAMLPRMLPEGSELLVKGPNGYTKLYKGITDVK